MASSEMRIRDWSSDGCSADLGAADRLRNGLEGDAYGVPGAVLGLLDGQHGLGHLLTDVRADLLTLGADDGNDALGLHRAHGVEDVADHAPTADLVQHLHGLGLHPGAATCGEDDHGEIARHAHSLIEPDHPFGPTPWVLTGPRSPPLPRFPVPVCNTPRTPPTPTP